MESALYFGWVRHRRFKPVAHAFSYSLYMSFLDLDELDDVFRGRWFWSARGFNLAWFRRADYMRGMEPKALLSDAVRDCVQNASGSRPNGPIRLLTNLRHFGYAMNPVSFYYCYDPDGRTLHSIVAEITNTPWKEQFAYVLPCAASRAFTQDSALRTQGLNFPPRQPAIETLPQRSGKPALHRFRFEKTFHVSPFMDMDFRYDWRFTRPGKQLAVHMINLKGGEQAFDSTLLMTRREISTGSLAAALARHPFVTLKTAAAIYFQAARLWLKKVPAYSHPKWLKTSTQETIAP